MAIRLILVAIFLPEIAVNIEYKKTALPIKWLMRFF